MSGFGWERYHVEIVSSLSQNAKEQMGSLGWDGPLAALSNTRANLADFFKETIAVVTNPSIDREREQAQFSSQVLIGCRPEIASGREEDATLIRLQIPLLLEAIPEFDDIDTVHGIATKQGTMLIQDLANIFEGKIAFLSMGCPMDTTIDQAVEQLQKRAVDAVSSGAQCVVLDDSAIAKGDELYIDPLLAVAAVDKALRQADLSPNLRRRTGIVVRSGALRDLHDLAICLSLGANAILPYAMYAVALGTAPRGSKKPLIADQVEVALGNTLKALHVACRKSLQPWVATSFAAMAHSFSSVGLSKNIASLLGTPNYFARPAAG